MAQIKPEHSISPISSGIRCRCPRCGEGKLFSGYLTPAKQCDMCDLDYSFMDSGDGPAVFVILIAGAIICTLVFIIEALFQPPNWVHGVIAFPLCLIIPLAILRPFKGVLINMQYRHDARPGQKS